MNIYRATLLGILYLPVLATNKDCTGHLDEQNDYLPFSELRLTRQILKA